MRCEILRTEKLLRRCECGRQCSFQVMTGPLRRRINPGKSGRLSNCNVSTPVGPHRLRVGRLETYG